MKNFIKFQLVLIVLLLSRSIKAQNWIYIAKNENGEKTYVNGDNVVKNANGTKMGWSKFTIVNYKLYQNGKTIIVPSVTYFVYSVYNCLSKTIKDITLIVKDNKGKVLFNNTKPESEQSEVYAISGTISLLVLNYICKNY